MLDTFYGTLPGAIPRTYAPSDTATFYDIYDVAMTLSSVCVGKKQEQAGWSFAGQSTHSSSHASKFREIASGFLLAFEVTLRDSC